MNVKKILYPTDFSKCSKQALRHAVFFAQQFDAELVMFHAVVLHADDPANPENVFPGGEKLIEAMIEVSSSRLGEWIPEDWQKAIRVREVSERGFSESDLILDFAGSEDVDIIVMGSHGRRGPARMFLGSVAERVIRHARCPVLSLRESETEREISAFERILVPVDYSECSRVAVAYGKQLAHLYGASMQVLHVVYETTYPSVYAVPTHLQLENVEARCLEAMDEIVQTTPGPAVPFDKHVVGGRPADEIVSFAESQGSDLIVIPSHGHTGLSRVLMGSTAEGVVRRSECPVLTVKPFGKSLIEDES